MITFSTSHYPRPWGLDLLAVMLFILTASTLMVALGERSLAATTTPTQATAMQRYVPKQPLRAPLLKAPSVETNPFPATETEKNTPPQDNAVSLEAQRKILKIINGDK